MNALVNGTFMSFSDVSDDDNLVFDTATKSSSSTMAHTAKGIVISAASSWSMLPTAFPRLYA